MAKGLRSKAMRKNRTYLRETLVKPLIAERQAKLAQSLKTKLEEQNASSLLKLKQLLPSDSATKEIPIIKDQSGKHESEDEDEMMVGNNGEEEPEESESERKTTQNQHAKRNKEKVVKTSRKSTKEMFWFT